MITPTQPANRYMQSDGWIPMALNGRLAVIGIGSPIMTDDSIGLRISESIQKLGMPDVDCFQEAVGGLELLPLLRGYSYAVIVDAIQTWNYDPGTILIFDVADFESTVHDVPSHDINVATAIKIGREMDPDTILAAMYDGIRELLQQVQQLRH